MDAAKKEEVMSERDILNIPAKVTEYYNTKGITICDSDYSNLKIEIRCNPCNADLEISMPSRTDIGRSNYNEPFESQLLQYINDYKGICPHCRAEEKEKELREYERLKKLDEERVEKNRQNRIFKISEMEDEIKHSPNHFWYYHFINLHINSASFRYVDKGWFNRVLLPLAEKIPPYKYNAILGYCFYRAPHIVEESQVPKSYTITVKSLMRRFMLNNEEWKINIHHEPVYVVETLLESYPELSHLEDILYHGVSTSYHDTLVEKSENVFEINKVGE